MREPAFCRKPDSLPPLTAKNPKWLEENQSPGTEAGRYRISESGRTGHADQFFDSTASGGAILGLFFLCVLRVLCGEKEFENVLPEN
jgi:hypothetical protein